MGWDQTLPQFSSPLNLNPTASQNNDIPTSLFGTLSWYHLICSLFNVKYYSIDKPCFLIQNTCILFLEHIPTSYLLSQLGICMIASYNYMLSSLHYWFCVGKCIDKQCIPKLQHLVNFVSSSSGNPLIFLWITLHLYSMTIYHTVLAAQYCPYYSSNFCPSISTVLRDKAFKCILQTRIYFNVSDWLTSIIQLL